MDSELFQRWVRLFMAEFDVSEEDAIESAKTLFEEMEDDDDLETAE